MKIGKEDLRLPKRFKDRWVKALRSGDYKQGQCYLVSKDIEGNKTYCCMGVICDLETNGRFTNSDKDSPLSRREYIPEVLRKNISLQEKLSNFNDTGGKSFKWISNWIDKNL